MSVYKPTGTDVFHYDFEYLGKRYRKTTGQLTRAEAQAVEANAKRDARRAAAGIAIPEASQSPRIQDWSEHYYADIEKKIGRPDRIDDLVRVALRFWGARPTKALGLSDDDAPYHDVRLLQVVQNPEWILAWEDWLDRTKVVTVGKPARTWSGQTKNQYRSVISGMFDLAMSPAWRRRTGVTSNPFAGGWRDEGNERDVALELGELRAILSVSSWHLRMAIAVGTLAPKLRESNILALRFDQHFSSDLRWLTVKHHKTRRKTKKPLVAYVPDQLVEILRDAKQRSRSPYVVSYRGKPVASVRGAVRAAVTRAATIDGFAHLTYGRFAENGITFHTLRHTAATILAEIDVTPQKQQQMMGHKRLHTTMRYTHLRPKIEGPVAEQLSTHLAIKDLVMAPWRRATNRMLAGKTTGTLAGPDADAPGNAGQAEPSRDIEQSALTRGERTS